jgi:hypothetical protein
MDPTQEYELRVSSSAATPARIEVMLESQMWCRTLRDVEIKAINPSHFTGEELYLVKDSSQPHRIVLRAHHRGCSRTALLSLRIVVHVSPRTFGLPLADVLPLVPPLLALSLLGWLLYNRLDQFISKQSTAW